MLDHGSATLWLAAVGLLGTTTVATADPPAFAEGTSFPNLVLPTLDGEPRSVADYRGQKLILHVFASW